jgi:hypothetical protein
MSEPASVLPELDAEDALRGVVNQLMINGERMSVIVPGSVIETLRLVGLLLSETQAGFLPKLVVQAMPWASPLPSDDLVEFAADLAAAAGSGDHAPEQVAALMREWRETAEVLGDPQALAELRESADAVAAGDVVVGRDAVRELCPRR